MNEDPFSNLAGHETVDVKYHGVHVLSILAYVLSIYEELYVVHFHHFILLHPLNILLELVTLLVLNLLDAYIVVKLLQLLNI